MCGSGATTDMVAIIIKAARVIIRKEHHPVRTVLFAAVAGSAAPGFAGWLVAAATIPAASATLLASASPETSNFIYFFN